MNGCGFAPKNSVRHISFLIASFRMRRVFVVVVCAVCAVAAAFPPVKPPTPVPIPRSCATATSQKLPYCDTSLSVDARVADLVQRLQPAEKAVLMTARASPLGNVSSIGLSAYDWGANW